MPMTMTMARGNRTRRAVTKEPGQGRVQSIGRGNERGLQRRKGRGRETVKGKVLLNKPQEEIISHMPLLCSCRRKCTRQTRTQRANQSGYI
jgi:hypothetical protein